MGDVFQRSRVHVGHAAQESRQQDRQGPRVRRRNRHRADSPQRHGEAWPGTVTNAETLWLSFTGPILII